MGTRSLTVIENGNGTEICVLYRQYDGYLLGHGQDLALFLKNKVITNGFGLNDGRDIANGMSNLAVQLITYLAKAMVEEDSKLADELGHKNLTFGQCVGQYYLHPAGTRHISEEYIYTIYEDWSKNPEGGVCLKVQEVLLEKVTGKKDEWQEIICEPMLDGAPIVTLARVNALIQLEKENKV
jgi:hypothetical protein